MKTVTAQISQVNIPAFITEEKSPEFFFLIGKLKEFTEKNPFIGIEQLHIVLLFDYDINKIIREGRAQFQSGKSFLWVAGLTSCDNEVYIEKDVLIAHLNRLLNYFSEYALIERFDIILLYNTDIEKLKLTEKKMPTKSQNESEDLSLFIPQTPKYTIEQVIMNNTLEKEIEATLLILEHKRLIYEEWGFNEVEPEPKAILNFHGPSGTGKTMTAHAIAHKMGIPILALNYADIESKYVGVAPKNLVKAFETAREKNAVLFFDEADSFLGKRVNVTSNADQSVNSLRSQLLILLENFSGLVILATNLLENYDKAFESRILKHLYFPLPDPETREKIINKSIPNRVPFESNETLNQDQMKKLVELSEGFSGRHIKNSVLGALTNAIQNNRRFVNFEDFAHSFSSIARNIEDFKNASNGGKIEKLDPKVTKVINTEIKKHYKKKTKA